MNPKTGYERSITKVQTQWGNFAQDLQRRNFEVESAPPASDGTPRWWVADSRRRLCLSAEDLGQLATTNMPHETFMRMFNCTDCGTIVHVHAKSRPKGRAIEGYDHAQCAKCSKEFTEIEIDGFLTLPNLPT